MPIIQPLERFLFALTPHTSELNTYDPAAPNSPWAIINFYVYGIHAGVLNNAPFGNQCNSDQILLAWNPVANPQGNPPPLQNAPNDIYRRCALDLRVWIHNWDAQLFSSISVTFSLAHWMGNPIAQFFLGAQWRHSEAINGDHFVTLNLGLAGINPAATFNAPPYANGFGVFVRLATNGPAYPMHGFFFKGVRCALRPRRPGVLPLP
jgi:hypothetical protein